MHACASPRIIRYEAQNAVSSLQAADVQVQKHCSVTCLHSASIHLFHLYVRIWYHACMVATSFRRPHRPRDENIRAIFKYAGLNLPGRFLNFAYLKFSSKHDGNMQEMMRMKVVTLTLTLGLCAIYWQDDAGDASTAHDDAGDASMVPAAPVVPKEDHLTEVAPSNSPASSGLHI